MPITLADSGNRPTVYAAERLQINFLTAKDNVEEMIVYY